MFLASTERNTGAVISIEHICQEALQLAARVAALRIANDRMNFGLRLRDFPVGEINGNPVGTQPCSWLTCCRILIESGLTHCFFDERVTTQSSQDNTEVTALCGFGYRDRRTTSVQIDGLSANNDHRVVAQATEHQPNADEPRASLRALSAAIFDVIDAHPWVGAQLSREPSQPAVFRIWKDIGSQLQLFGLSR
jgi:hypothetical protein